MEKTSDDNEAFFTVSINGASVQTLHGILRHNTQAQEMKAWRGGTLRRSDRGLGEPCLSRTRSGRQKLLAHEHEEISFFFGETVLLCCVGAPSEGSTDSTVPAAAERHASRYK
jgi:hypothetical protein